MGLIIGVVLNEIVEKISLSIAKNKSKNMNIFIPILCGIFFEILFLRFGITIILVKAMIMTAILIIISFIDLKYRIIPDFMVIITLISGIIFAFITQASFLDIILGMIFGGGVLFLLAFIPNVMGGGDIKLMFALGAFLGLRGTLWSLCLAFILSAVISIVLILLKIKGTKDYIPFGPFLSLGSFISLLIFI